MGGGYRSLALRPTHSRVSPRRGERCARARIIRSDHEYGVTFKERRTSLRSARTFRRVPLFCDSRDARLYFEIGRHRKRDEKDAYNRDKSKRGWELFPYYFFYIDNVFNYDCVCIRFSLLY